MIVGTTEAAKILNISTARLRVLLSTGRVEGAYKSGKMWLMPLFNGKPIIQRCKKGPAPRWRNPRTPAKTIVHVNTHKIRENQKHNLQQPVITVKKRKVGGVGFRSPCRPVLPQAFIPDVPAKLFKKRCNSSDQTHFLSDAALPTPTVDSRTNGYLNLYGHEVEILGGCRVVYRPNSSKHGAQVWIETLYDVTVTCWD